ncbi:MAG: pyruvate kinase [Betaproteobacteria bacterium]|jgi:pyruvate kinase (EC 2.7.1.40)|nr:pyruvate kinase [Betaproteobacteria bacterium]
MLRRTKIVATLGPSSTSPEVLERMILAGMDMARLNFSHGTEDDHRSRVETIRTLAKKLGRTVGILGDLQGPKIRVGKFQEGKILLKAGDTFILDAQCPLGNQDRVGLDYKELPHDVQSGDALLLDDGKIELEVLKVFGNEVHTRVIQGGILSNNKGINRRGGGLTAPALTDKDREDIILAAKLKVDYLAVSFPRSGADMNQARALLVAAGGTAQLQAKIERAEAIDALEDIIAASDSIMVARGDLAVEVGDAAVPALQKRMIRLARQMNKTVITATQMMESMISSPVPTRAEVSDVANAVLDGTDAVMLSAESAAGQFPVESIAAMARICAEAEKQESQPIVERQTRMPVDRIETAVARAVIHTSHHLPVKAVAALTQSGTTALLISRADTHVPIYAMTPTPETQQRVTLYRGVYPVAFHHTHLEPEAVIIEAEALLLKQGAVKPGDLMLLTMGEPIGKAGGTNTLKILRVGEHSA